MKRLFCISLAAFTLVLAPLNALAYEYYTIDRNGRTVPTTKTYVHEYNISVFNDEESRNLLQPSDLFIDGKDNMYIVDTGNDRVLKTDLMGNIIKIYGKDEAYGFKKPGGVFVDDDGDLYVADTENNRIVHIDSDGSLIEEFKKPESDLLSDDYTFSPAKICIGPTGYIYITSFQNLLCIDPYNRFRGFIGQSKVQFSFTNLLIMLFASKEQKDRITRTTAAPINNVFIDKEGMIYAATKDNQYGELKKFNFVGNNLLPSRIYGEMYNHKPQNFIDITVDKFGLITAIDDNSGKIYQYDQNGNLLTVFGGIGAKSGYFQKPSSIANDSAGRLYVLDFSNAIIQVFTPTHFVELVQQATVLNNEGRYNQALEVWEEVQTINRNYSLANMGLAKSYDKQGDYKKAMYYYEKADYRPGFSDALANYRSDFVKNNFLIVIACIAACGVLVYFYICVLRKVSNKILDKYFSYRRDE